MNIFYLDEDVSKAAQYLNDKLCVKMILEYAQMKCSAHRELDGPSDYEYLYRSTHKNHPSAKWVRESKANYEYLYKLFSALCEEYTYRYGKTHLTYTKLHNVLAIPPKNITDGKFTQPTPAMPDDVKHIDSLIAYRDYYKKYKTHLATLTKRESPSLYV